MDTEIINQFIGWIAILIVWTLIWKGLALWRAARMGQKGWFVALLIINTVGILEIIYLLVTQEKMKEKAMTKPQEKNL